MQCFGFFIFIFFSSLSSANNVSWGDFPRGCLACLGRGAPYCTALFTVLLSRELIFKALMVEKEAWTLSG